MKLPAVNVYLNRFPVKKLRESDQIVQVYSCNFIFSPEQGKEQNVLNIIPWKIGKTSGVRFGSKIITKQKIFDTYLNNEFWTLEHQGPQFLSLEQPSEKDALERLERRWIWKELEEISDRNRIQKSSERGLIWWNANRTILQDSGWEVHTGVSLDIELHSSGMILAEIDTHHRFYSPWTLEQWLQNYQNIPIKWVRNTYSSLTWKFVRTSDEDPEEVILTNTEMSLADYHRKLPQNPATEAEIINSRVVYLNNKNNQEISHLSSRLRPSVTMEMLGDLKEQGSQEAAKVFAQTRQSTQVRFDKGNSTAKWIAEKIYNIDKKIIETRIKPQKNEGIIFRSKSPLLLTKFNKVHRPLKSLEVGCYATGERQFGCLNLTDNSGWSKFVSDQLESVAKKSDVNIVLETAKNKQDLPDRSLVRQQFWQNWSDQGIKTVLVITPWLENTVKNQYQREALEANIALQFMQPMFQLEKYRLANIILGLLLKAKWQPVGLEPIKDQYASEIVIGFDAGTDKQIYYGTSAFAILANGQSLGWELPEAQPGEKLSGQAVWRTVRSIVNRFYTMENRLPQRIMLLRDGIVQADEFKDTVDALLEENIAVDLLSVRKSGAGRMAILPYQSEFLKDASPGTAILSADGKTFRIVTSEAKAGGSARPLQVIRDYGDAPLEILACQIDRLSMLNPASAYAYSRLPYVLHFADKMAKTVQNLGGISILQGVDRHKIFFA
jgi:hypothetical protein